MPSKFVATTLHILAVIGVLLAPPLVYNATQSYVGALTYPAYLLYWLVKINSDQVRFVSINTLLVLCAISVATTASCDTFNQHPWLIVAPLLVGLAPIAWLIPPRNAVRYPRRAYIISGIVGFTLGGAFAAFAAIAFSRCAMSGMRW